MYKATRQEVDAAITSERHYQQVMWDGYNGEPDNPLEIGEFLVLLDEYVQQAKAEWCKERTKSESEAGSLHTVRKIGAIAVNCMRQHGAPGRMGFIVTPYTPEDAVIRNPI